MNKYLQNIPIDQQKQREMSNYRSHVPGLPEYNDGSLYRFNNESEFRDTSNIRSNHIRHQGANGPMHNGYTDNEGFPQMRDREFNSDKNNNLTEDSLKN
mmetsp:Transcript_12807/g.12715  ORF Transcript_12807/g.12715 Transcript_12807/m.12715 type:complete len:99 (+) Transcript_12807:696-992(+)